MNKQTTIIVSAIVVASLVIIGVGVAIYNAGVDSHTGLKVDTKAAVEAVEPKKDTQVSLKSDDFDDYISGAERIFVESCDDGSNTSYCKCSYDWLNDNLTNDEFRDVTIEAERGNIPDEMYEALKACS